MPLVSTSSAVVSPGMMAAKEPARGSTTMRGGRRPALQQQAETGDAVMHHLRHHQVQGALVLVANLLDQAALAWRGYAHRQALGQACTLPRRLLMLIFNALQYV